MLPELLTTAQLSDYLQVPVGTLHQWRSRGAGPPGFRLGKQVRYRRADVDAWLCVQEELERRGERVTTRVQPR